MQQSNIGSGIAWIAVVLLIGFTWAAAHPGTKGNG